MFNGTVTIKNNGSPKLTLSTFEKLGGALVLFPEGGAVTAIQASIVIDGKCSVNNSYAENGGVFYATKSRIHIVWYSNHCPQCSI